MSERIHFLANERHYAAATEHDPRKRSDWKGHAGREFTVRFADGRVLVTDDLWWEWTAPAPHDAPEAEIAENWPPTRCIGWSAQMALELTQ